MRLMCYLLRWQLSTPVLALIMWLFRDRGELAAAITANFIGGLIFYPLDKVIFREPD